MKWEYHTETTYDLNDINGSDEFRELYQLVTNTFKQLGQEGWELVSVDNGIAYFKRAISRDMSEFKSGMVWRTMTPEEMADKDAKKDIATQERESKAIDYIQELYQVGQLSGYSKDKLLNLL